MQKIFSKNIAIGMKISLILLILLSVFSLSNPVFAKKLKLPSSELTLKQASEKYWSIYDQFTSKVCSKNALQDFNSKLSIYRGEGFYLPIINNQIYPEVLDGVLQELELKRQWLVASIIKLKKMRRLPRVSKELNRALSSINKILKFQEQKTRFNKALSPKELKKKEQAFSQLKENLSRAIQDSFYLTRYRFPVDHFINRLRHDAYYKKKKNLEAQKEQKEIFLLRKLLEDGAPGKSHSGSDKFFRTALDTVALGLPTLKDWLSEAQRYDLEYIIKAMKKLSKNSPWHYVERFRKWRDKTKEQITFYKQLRIQAKRADQGLKKKLALKKRATTNLSSYVKNKQFESYQFWMKQPPFFRALYSLETILFNEVGNVDPSGLERSDVLQVVLNRYQQKYYRRLKKGQKLYRLASAKGIKRSEYPWLNILLNRGEFSFTLYYFKASHETFCPSMNKSLQKLRDENFKIAYDILKKPRYEFNAERYFSRASMTGRIDISGIWSNFQELPQRPGRMIQDSKKLKLLNRKLKWDKYRFLYSFKEEQMLHVIEIEGKNYVLQESEDQKIWYEHRNPHYFRYFAVK